MTLRAELALVMTFTRVLAVAAILGLLIPAALLGEWVFFTLGLVGVGAFLVPFLSRR